jgi:nitrite reductase (NADH) small subunit
VSTATEASVCAAADVPLGEGRAVTVEGRRVAVFNAPTGWYALDHACPHRGGPLADGIVADACVTCPLHERRYDLATGAALLGGEAVTAHEVEVRDGEVIVTLATESSPSSLG